MKITVYEGRPGYAEPIQWFLSPSELDAIREDCEDRACEPQLHYRHAIERGDTRRALSLAASLKLVEPNEERLVRAEHDLHSALGRMA